MPVKTWDELLSELSTGKSAVIKLSGTPSTITKFYTNTPETKSPTIIGIDYCKDSGDLYFEGYSKPPTEKSKQLWTIKDVGAPSAVKYMRELINENAQAEKLSGKSGVWTTARYLQIHELVSIYQSCPDGVMIKVYLEYVVVRALPFMEPQL